MALVCFYPKEEIIEKPENSPTFFSSRKPDSTVVYLRDPSGLPTPADHPWRYFIAGGESLAKIKQVIADSEAVSSDLELLAAEVGAQEVKGSDFIFSDAAEVEPVATELGFTYGLNANFICSVATPGSFVPDMLLHFGRIVKAEMAATESLASDQVEAARKALASKYQAESFDGTFFHFSNWQAHLKTGSKPSEKMFRLKSNPVFLRREYNKSVYIPDMETGEGFRIAMKLDAIQCRKHPQTRLADWISSFVLDISLAEARRFDYRRPTSAAEAERIDDEWIIKVAVNAEGIFGPDGRGGGLTGTKEGWVLPPDATGISVSEYYAKLEKSGNLLGLASAAPATVVPAAVEPATVAPAAGAPATAAPETVVRV